MILASKIHKVSGPPGTGKTTHLIGKVEELLNSGVSPDDIVYTTFTRAGAYEARDRACAKFNLNPNRLPYFRTLHSLCYQMLPKMDVMNGSDWFAIARALGLFFSNKQGPEEGVPRGSTKGDYLLTLWSLSRVTGKPLEEIFATRDNYARGFPSLGLPELEHFAKSVSNYKREMGKIDYTDMLEKYLSEGPDMHVKYVIVDEAQDLSHLQWQVVEKLCANAEGVWIAGDDDQCIHAWNGADPGAFIKLEAQDHHVLPQSYRIPSSVHDIAGKIITKVGTRIEKQYRAREATGAVERIADLANIDLAQGTWLLLARNNCFLNRFNEMCRSQGVLFSGTGENAIKPAVLEAIQLWKYFAKGGQTTSAHSASTLYRFLSQRDRVTRGFKTPLSALAAETPVTLAELMEKHGLVCDPKTLPWYEALDMIPEDERDYLHAVDRKEGLNGTCRVNISTIHGAKGREADNVVLLPDMTWRTFEAMNENADNEHRVFYVGATRAKEKLFLVQPASDKFYDLP